MMRHHFTALVLTAHFLTGCSIPELEQREPKIAMAPWPASTPKTLAEARKAQINSRGSPFGQYDARVTGTIQKRWEESLKIHNIQSSGKVVLEFRLVYDGRVTELRVAETDMTALPVQLCERAVFDSVPFDPWPKEMRQLFPLGRRDVRLTFHYHGKSKPPNASVVPKDPPHRP